ncbi:MAG TPA: citryl-CoA lyase [Noviherbaspirillum sp.]
MSDVDPANLIHTRIWQEEPEPDNPFATRAAYCRGYDVFGEMVGNARWVEMLLLLFRDELPDTAAVNMLEALAVALANPGPRDPSVHAAMCGGVGGSTAAAALIAALSVGAGRNGGAREVFDAMTLWSRYGTNLDAWRGWGQDLDSESMEVWPAPEHCPGFDPHGVSATKAVCQLLETLAGLGNFELLRWLLARRQELQEVAGRPLALTGVAAAAFVDLGFVPKEGEMLYLLLRLPGAAAHALEQEQLGFKRFPFYAVELDDVSSARKVS